MAETLIGIFLLALLIAVVFNLFPTTILANRQGSERLQAVIVAETTLSEVRSRPFDAIVIGATETMDVQRRRGTDFEPVLRVLRPPDGDPDRLKVLEVTVTWRARNIQRSLVERLWIHRCIEEKA